MITKQNKAKIVFEDGTVFKGYFFGASGEKCGEVVFNTSMTGYEEIITDPSYKGQIVTMTYPLIGNYGINDEDVESCRPFIEGLIVKECSHVESNWRSNKSLRQYLKENNVLGVEGVDTRAITRHIRSRGAMKAIISTEGIADKEAAFKAKNSPGLIGRDLVKEVISSNVERWNETGRYKVVVINCGVKFNILRELAERDCRVVIVPAFATCEQILAQKPDGILVSNGPGDPEGALYIAETIKKLLDRIPIFGICFGHQILALALGGKTYKLKFGHHGGNHPVKDLRTGKVSITAQNHGFCVDINSLKKEDIEVTHVNLNDKTLEGMKHKKFPVFSVQFHPEASPGPHDSRNIFKEFITTMENRIAEKK